MSYRQMIAPTDLSDPSFEGVKVAARLARQFDAELLLIHVVPAAGTDASDDWKDMTKMQLGLGDKREIDDARKQLSRLTNQYGADGISVEFGVRYGNAAEEIVAAAKENDGDLIVIATHGRSGWRRLVFGSVTEELLRHAPCHVLCVPEPRAEA